MAQVRTVLLRSVQNIPSSSSICTGFTLSPFSPSQLPRRAPALFCPSSHLRLPSFPWIHLGFLPKQLFLEGSRFPSGFHISTSL